MKRKIFNISLLVFFILLTFSSKAHPSWGIVSASDGTVYFVDVLSNFGTLWKYNLGNKHPEKVFSGHFHAHNLQIDTEDNLYIGLHIYIDGRIMGDGHNYLLKYDTKRQALDTLVFSKSYEVLFGGNVIVDPSCETYYYTFDKKIHRANLHSQDAGPWIDHEFERISTLTLDKYGKLWVSDPFTNGGSLYHVDSFGILTEYARNLIPDEPENPVFEEKRFQLFYGISFDDQENPIVCDSGSRKLTKILPGLKSEVLYTSPKHFFPVGVCFVGDIMIIMESGYIPGKGNQSPRLIIKSGDGQLTVALH